MAAHTVTFVLNGAGVGSVIVDAHDISNLVTKLSVEAQVGQPSRVWIELKGVAVEADLTGAAVTLELPAAEPLP